MVADQSHVLPVRLLFRRWTNDRRVRRLQGSYRFDKLRSDMVVQLRQLRRGGRAFVVFGRWTRIVCASGETGPGQFGGPLLTSTNSGRSWVSNSLPNTDWSAVPCSADGTRLLAAGLSRPLLTSTNFGVSWRSNNTPALSWNAAACSADGRKLFRRFQNS